MEERIGLALTGHRPPRLAGYDLNHPFYQNLQATLESLIERALVKYQVVDCHSGMALGADTVWSLTILACQERHGSDRVRFHAEMPNRQHGSNWPAKSQAQHIKTQANFGERLTPLRLNITPWHFTPLPPRKKWISTISTPTNTA